MAKSLLDKLREHLEGVENAWLYLLMLVAGMALLSILTLTGVYFYTRR
jgi:hypothetical protein